MVDSHPAFQRPRLCGRIFQGLRSHIFPIPASHPSHHHLPRSSNRDSVTAAATKTEYMLSVSASPHLSSIGTVLRSQRDMQWLTVGSGDHACTAGVGPASTSERPRSEHIVSLALVIPRGRQPTMACRTFGVSCRFPFGGLALFVSSSCLHTRGTTARLAIPISHTVRHMRYALAMSGECGCKCRRPMQRKRSDRELSLSGSSWESYVRQAIIAVCRPSPQPRLRGHSCGCHVL